ncbi:MAG: elongation factor P, partial [Oscillospiraceae bacterium]|nr:elongation factor P [Oscillospiraceae bacterium]
LFYFMDMESFEQIPLEKGVIGDALKFVKDNTVCKVLTYKEGVFGIEPPFFVELEIVETEPGIKGDTATGANKTATVETGAVIRVPLFVNQGDVVKVDTRTGQYMERV